MAVRESLRADRNWLYGWPVPGTAMSGAGTSVRDPSFASGFKSTGWSASGRLALAAASAQGATARRCQLQSRPADPGDNLAERQRPDLDLRVTQQNRRGIQCKQFDLPQCAAALFSRRRRTAAKQQRNRLPAELDFVNDPRIGDLSVQDTGLRLNRGSRRQNQGGRR